MVARQEAWPGLHDRDRHAEARVDLRKLAARRAATEHQERLRQLARERRLVVGPHAHVADPLDRRHLRHRPDRQQDVVRREPAVPVRAAHLDLAARGDARIAADDRGPDALERLDVARVVGLLGVRRTVDHVVAPLRGPPPRVVLAGGVAARAVEQGLRRDAADVRAAAAEPEAVGDRDPCPALPGLVRRRLAGRPGADDREVVAVSHAPPSPQPR
jgi:hypothetical protein